MYHYFSLPHVIVGIVASVLIGLFYTAQHNNSWWPWSDDHTHSEEFHIHADLRIVIDGEVMNLARPEYMSTAESIRHDHVHLHDNDGEVVHIHAPHISLVTFLNSLGITLTDTCLTVDQNSHCTDESNTLKLIVNGEPYEVVFTSYVPKDLDQILLFFGTKEDTDRAMQEFQNVSDRACIFSGSCPERGLPPPESCGLTCEL